MKTIFEFNNNNKLEKKMNNEIIQKITNKSYNLTEIGLTIDKNIDFEKYTENTLKKSYVYNDFYEKSFFNEKKENDDYFISFFIKKFLNKIGEIWLKKICEIIFKHKKTQFKELKDKDLEIPNNIKDLKTWALKIIEIIEFFQKNNKKNKILLLTNIKMFTAIEKAYSILNYSIEYIKINTNFDKKAMKINNVEIYPFSNLFDKNDNNDQTSNNIFFNYQLICVSTETMKILINIINIKTKKFTEIKKYFFEGFFTFFLKKNIKNIFAIVKNKNISFAFSTIPNKDFFKNIKNKIDNKRLNENYENNLEFKEYINELNKNNYNFSNINELLNIIFIYLDSYNLCKDINKECKQKIKNHRIKLTSIQKKTIIEYKKCLHYKNENKTMLSYFVEKSFPLDWILNNEIKKYSEIIEKKMKEKPSFNLYGKNKNENLYIFSKKEEERKKITLSYVVYLIKKYKIKVIFTNERKLVSDFKDTWNNLNLSSTNLLNKLNNIDLLVIDDFGMSDLSGNIRDNFFYLLLSTRFNNNKLTFITSFFDFEEIEKIYKFSYEKLEKIKNESFIKLMKKNMNLIKI